MNIGKHEALQALTPNAKYIIRDNDLEWLDEDITKPTDEEINNKISELETAYNNKQYQRDRADAYPSIQEQLDMQYWDSVNGTTTWKDAIAKVKSDHAKESE